MKSPQIEVASTDVPSINRRKPSRVGGWLIGIILGLLLVIYITSFFLDGIIRPRIEANMNNGMKGYHVTLGHAHLQLIGLRLSLDNLIVAQEAHPVPPVADFPSIEFRIHWRALLSGHVLANVRLSSPKIHINLAQLSSERQNKTPARDRGWQDALQDAYPFKINRFVISDGDITYLDKSGAKPLHITKLNFVSDNIRNISEPDNLYPSSFRARMTVFDTGVLSLQGRANYLMKPFPGMTTRYVITRVPLSAVTPASKHINLIVKGGTFSSEGSIEYSPKITNVDVRELEIDSVDLTYVHLRQTQSAETQRITTAGQTIEKENNRPAVDLKLRQLDIRDSRLAFDNEASDPPYVLFLTSANVTVTNLSNHEDHGLSHANIDGLFMGSGRTQASGTFVASQGGPEFTSNIQILNTDMTALNPLLRAYGRFDVAKGLFTLYAQLAVRNAQVKGFVKPMFSNLQVYARAKDKNKGVLQQAKELLIGSAAHLLKNSSTQQVATQVNIDGTLKDPNVSTWQAFVEVIRNAFIEAILPGFDRQYNSAQTVSGSPAAPPVPSVNTPPPNNG